MWIREARPGDWREVMGLLALESASWRDRAHAFYEREGFEDLAHAFVRVLADVDWPPKPRP